MPSIKQGKLQAAGLMIEYRTFPESFETVWRAQSKKLVQPLKEKTDHIVVVGKNLTSNLTEDLAVSVRNSNYPRSEPTITHLELNCRKNASVNRQLSELSAKIHLSGVGRKSIVILVFDDPNSLSVVLASVLSSSKMEFGEVKSLIEAQLPKKYKLTEREVVTSEILSLGSASLFGGAIGDALGADVEFFTLEEILRAYPRGKHELSSHSVPSTGWFTDDTQMTLFTAEGLIRAYVRGALKGISSAAGVVGHSLLRWAATQGSQTAAEPSLDSGLVLDRRLHFQAAPGLTCLSALEGARSFGERADNNSKGCGTIMRVAPVALYAYANSSRNSTAMQNWTRDTAIETSQCTHGHSTAWFAAAAWAEIIYLVLCGEDLRTAANTVTFEYRALCNETYEALSLALSARQNAAPETIEMLGEGWVAEEALAMALYACLCAESFEHCLQIAITHSGDSDSVGAIAGNLLGLMFPDEVFRSPFFAELRGKDIISTISRDLMTCCNWGREHTEAMFEYYPGY